MTAAKARNGEVMNAILDVLGGGPATTGQIAARLGKRRPQIHATLRVMEQKGMVVHSLPDEAHPGWPWIWTVTAAGCVPVARRTISRRTVSAEVLEVLADGPATSKEIAAALESKTGKKHYRQDVTENCRKLEKRGLVTHEEVECKHVGNHPPYRWMLSTDSSGGAEQ